MLFKDKDSIKFIIFLGITLIFIIFLFFSIKSETKINRISQDIRRVFRDQLKILPDPDFMKTLKHTPSKDEIELGRMLFNDPILSRNNDVSCATCHLSNHGFADGNRLNFGALGKGGSSRRQYRPVMG